MSTFSIIGITFLALVIIIGTILKIALRKRREKLEGFHGYVQDNKSEMEKSETDEWESL